MQRFVYSYVFILLLYILHQLLLTYRAGRAVKKARIADDDRAFLQSRVTTPTCTNHALTHACMWSNRWKDRQDSDGVNYYFFRVRK